MLHEETHQKLMAMKLYGLAASLQEYLDGKAEADLSFEDRFGLMVDREWSERQARILKRRLSSAKLREPACVEDINYRHPRQLDRSVMQRLSTCRWVANHDTVIITGPTGVGKTWIACALADRACRDGHTAVYTRIPRLLPRLQIARADGSYPNELQRLARADVLILDDLGLAKLGDMERRDLLEILEDRHGLRSTIVTSQKPVNLWHDDIGDPTVADAILDRLVHSSHRIELKGNSLRKGEKPREEE